MDASTDPPLSPSNNPLQGMDAAALERSFVDHLEYSLAKDEYSATERDRFVSLALSVRDRLIERWIETQQTYYRRDAKRVYYLSLEFLMGRLLDNGLTNLGLRAEAEQAVDELGYQLEDLVEQEFDAGLGNGGLGRLAACFLDSMATMALPAYGYGLRYEYGIFFQRIFDGFQVETPDNWLRYGNPWEIGRPEYLYPVKFYGRVEQRAGEGGRLEHVWVDAREVMAMAYDVPVPGYGNDTVNTLRLWAAKASREFDLEPFNYGAYEKAVEDKSRSETITRVLYPNDNFFVGRELRLKQQYFFVSATLQDAIRRHRKKHASLVNFADKQVVQLNDTHPSIAIAELMRILVDSERFAWEDAWQIVVATFAYTNHTVLPEALEKWRVWLLENVLPRHMEIIYEINRRFLDEVRVRFPGDDARVRRMSIIEEGEEKRVRMAQLAIVGSHAVNGVAELHTRILKEELFRDFYELWPHKFSNKTNGITPRRWLAGCNRSLAGLISEHIGSGWTRDLDQLRQLEPLVEDAAFRARWRAVKRDNKERLAQYIATANEVEVDIDSLFSCQIKRIHEYKRQLLNAFYAIVLYNRLKDGLDVQPRTLIFSGKAAPGYYLAKLIIKLINSISATVNHDEDIGGRLKVVFLANYGVSLAERIIPAADLSEQLSTAGMEASGTGNMKFALNGALTIGTLDGANIEIMEEVGRENIFIFGLETHEVQELKATGYDPGAYYRNDDELRRVVDMVASGFFCPARPDLFQPIVDSLVQGGDPYLVLADFAAYRACQEEVSAAYQDSESWTRRSILNCARTGKFSSDRTIAEYARDIWRVDSVPVELGAHSKR